MGLPVVYRTGAEAGIASYDYTDIASGIGYEQFFMLYSADDTAVQYSLQPNANLYSYIIETKITNTSPQLQTYDSSAFNLPRTVKGTAYFNIGVANNSGGDSAIVSATLQKYDGTTATNITSSAAFAVGGILKRTWCFEMPCTETNIKVGEQLRLVVTFDTPGVSGGETLAIGHDPKNREGATVSPASGAITASNISVPFKIDL